MASGKRLVYFVTIPDEQGELHTFGPDDDLPGWARKAITNPSAWGEESADDAASDEDDDTDEPVAYDSMLKADLEAEISKRNDGRDPEDQIEVEAPGNKAELIAALRADDAAFDEGD